MRSCGWCQPRTYSLIEPGTVIFATAIEIMVSSSGSTFRDGRRESLSAYCSEPPHDKHYSSIGADECG
jgi:hypothetical protein